MLDYRLRQILRGSAPARDGPLCYQWDHVLPNSLNSQPRSVITSRYIHIGRLWELRYTMTIPCPDEWFPALDVMATISVIDRNDGRTFERRIPAAYLFHLRWIRHEAFPVGVSTPTQLSRATWLRQVLDAFVEEIEPIVDMSNWRSTVLNPVLVRAFYAIDDFKRNAILKNAQTQVATRGSKMDLKHWESFYFNLDIVSPVHRDWWLSIKQSGLERHPHDDIGRSTSEECTGSVLLRSLSQSAC